MTIKEIVFDQEDKTLFGIDDLQLKADAIRYAILPKLEIINNELISRITNLYEVSFYDHYSVAKTPHFRLAKTQRKEETKTNYTYSAVSITGQRKDNKWLGLDRGTGTIPKISPTSLSIDLTPEGLRTYFFFNYPANFTKATYEKFFAFFSANIDIISGLAFKAGLAYQFAFIDNFTLARDFEFKLKTEQYDVLFAAPAHEYPITYKKINEIIYSNVLMFPVLNACIAIALGEEPEFENDMSMLEDRIDEYVEHYFTDEEETETAGGIPEDQLTEIRVKAGSKIKVMAGMRWQVFKRDSWKCVACGRSAEADIILHVDHILPRSKGGKDEMHNYQTLCETCNIGKSNKDETDLRIK